MKNKKLSEATVEELKSELLLREKQQLILKEPKLINVREWEPDEVITLAENHTELIISGEYHEDSHDPEYMFEAVMEMLYGKDYFTWVNKMIGNE